MEKVGSGNPLVSDEAEYPFESNIRETTIFRTGKPYKYCFSYNMIIWDKTPEAGVSRIMPVIAHQKVVILLKGIRTGNLTINKDTAVLYFKFVAFINFNDTAIQS
jgi:hypothetical protein